MASFTCVLAFLGPCVTYICGLLVFKCMDTNNVVFKFSLYLLPIVVHELLPNLDFTLPIFFSFNTHNLGRLWSITDDFATIPFHHILFSAALVGLAKSIPVHSLIFVSISSSRYLFFFLLLCYVGLSLLNQKTFRCGKTNFMSFS